MLNGSSFDNLELRIAHGGLVGTLIPAGQRRFADLQPEWMMPQVPIYLGQDRLSAPKLLRMIYTPTIQISGGMQLEEVEAQVDRLLKAVNLPQPKG